MFTKAFISAALAASVLTLSNAAYAETVYLGGPKGMTTVRTTTTTVQTNKPYAQYQPAERTGAANKHIYIGGPKSSLSHR